MYKTKKIDALVEKACAEAEKAAQEICNKYSLEIKKLIKSQINNGDSIKYGMGLVIFENIDYENSTIEQDKFLETLRGLDQVGLIVHFDLDIKKKK